MYVNFCMWTLIFWPPLQFRLCLVVSLSENDGQMVSLETSLDSVWIRFQEVPRGRVGTRGPCLQILFKNPNTSGGTQVPDIGESMLQTAERPLDIWNKTLAMEVGVKAVLADLQSMRTPTTYLCPWTTAGTLRVTYLLSLQIFLPRANHLDSHTQKE